MNTIEHMHQGGKKLSNLRKITKSSARLFTGGCIDQAIIDKSRAKVQEQRERSRRRKPIGRYQEDTASFEATVEYCSAINTTVCLLVWRGPAPLNYPITNRYLDHMNRYHVLDCRYFVVFT